MHGHSEKLGKFTASKSYPCILVGKLGSYHFLGGGGDRLFVMAGRQFFLVPPFACVKKYWSPPLTMGKNTGPPLCLQKNSSLTCIMKEPQMVTLCDKDTVVE